MKDSGVAGRWRQMTSRGQGLAGRLGASLRLPLALAGAVPLMTAFAIAHVTLIVTPATGAEKWDVNAAHGPVRQITIDTREGTWMNVDVSPDGATILFDLLGDIYRMPITGGDAVALTTGPAWDMQPRFSPDGVSIAFTSDRGGGDNLWVMSATGEDPSPLTTESFRLLNSPAWSPRGEYIVGRKHFTSRRSLGAGEMWMFHLAGGKGLQLTTRANDQKDEGEPVFSPCGRYLYTSQDATPGSTFEYSKDPNTQIYRINRLDLETGEREPFITGPGGAVRPTPSPDGKLIAFVRRIRYQSVLHLMEIESGRVWPVYDQLDRDMQETWAVHGVYPSMAWMPDGKSIVLWAGGQIRRVDVATGDAAVIPFHVKQVHSITEALRTPIEVAPKMFDIKMPRWTSVSPDDSRVVFQTLGHLYIRDLPAGEPRRVTAQQEHFEFCPSFSRDGKWIVYTTWDDDDLGAVRIVWADGGEGRVLTDEPGHYVDPAMSPDGKTVVFGRVSGGYLRTPIWSRDTGVYRVPVIGGAMQRITPRGTSPQFGATSDRVYLYAGNDDVELISIRLDGTDERTHVTSSNATEMRISPDGAWLAFAERFNVHLMPFIPTGRAISVGPDASSLPFERVTTDAGSSIHWSGDSSTLYWTNGPTLSVCPVEDVFAFAGTGEFQRPAAVGDDRDDDNTADEEGDDNEAESDVEKAIAVTTIDLGFRVPYDVPAGQIAIVNARIITMRGDDVIERGTVLIEGNRIVSVTKGDLARIPDDAFVIDGKGKTVVPGYCDVHAHGAQARNGMTPEQNWIHFANLAFGVTTIHDPSNQTSSVFAAAEMAKAGVITSPRTFSTGTILYGAAGSSKAEIESLDDARFHVKRMQDVGAISVKSYNQPRRDQRQQVVEAARELGMMVVPEGGSLLQHNLTMILDGHTTIEHSIPVARAYDDVLSLWAASETAWTPTLVVGFGGNWGENYFYQKDDVWENERLMSFVPRRLVDPRSRRRTMVPDEEFNHIDIARIGKALIDRGGHVQIGAHGQLAGLGAHWEMWMLAQGGFTPLEMLRAGTLDAARAVGLDGDLGSIEVGKLADVLVLDDNPLDDVRATERIQYTILNGRVFDARTMNQVYPATVERGRFHFERPGANTGLLPSITTCAGCSVPGGENGHVERRYH